MKGGWKELDLNQYLVYAIASRVNPDYSSMLVAELEKNVKTQGKRFTKFTFDFPRLIE